MIKPVLSIIIISYNTADITFNCLKSILKDKGLEFNLKKPKNSSQIPTEIILVDNASTDNTLAKLKTIKPLTIIKNSQNLGFAKANNQAIKIAKGNYLLLLNSDTLILHSSISQSLNWLSSHPQAIACTAQLLNPNRSIQASGGFFPNLLNLFTWSTNLDDLPLVNRLIKPIHPHSPAFYTKDKFYLKSHPQDWITGAFMLIRRSSLGKLLFDPNYFMYAEEIELCWRLKQKNPQGQIWYLTDPQVIHFGNASSNPAFAIQNEYKGILAFFQKHHSPLSFKIAKILLKVNCFFRLPFSRVHRQVWSKL